MIKNLKIETMHKQETKPYMNPYLAGVLLGLVFMLATLLVFGGIACFSGHFAAWLQRHTQAQGWLDTLAGLVFLALALRLVAAEWWSL